MNKLYILPIISLALVTSGCVSSMTYKRPDAPVPVSLPSGASGISAQGDLSSDNLKWQDVFPDKNLQEIITLALANNRDLKIAALNVERVRALYGVKRAELLPAVNAIGTASKTRTPADISQTGSAMTSEQYSVDLGVSSWEIDLFGRLRSQKKQALEEYLSSEEARRGAQTALVGEVARAYLTLAADRENLKLAQSTLEAQQSVYAMIQKQFDGGVATELDLRRSQTQVDAAKGDIARYTQVVTQDRNALDLLVGVPVSDEKLPKDLSAVTPPRDIAPGLSSEVLLRRPDIMAAEHQLKAAHAFIDVARTALFPRISLTSTIGTASADLTGLFNSGSETWGFIPQVTMPIFDARVWAGLRVSKATREIALAQYEKTIQIAFREVADALAARGTMQDQVAAQDAVVQSAQKVYELSNQRYTQGIDGYLGVLDAQRSLYAAQQGLTYLRLAKILNQVRFFAVLGGDVGP